MDRGRILANPLVDKTDNIGHLTKLNHFLASAESSNKITFDRFFTKRTKDLGIMQLA